MYFSSSHPVLSLKQARKEAPVGSSRVVHELEAELEEARRREAEAHQFYESELSSLREQRDRERRKALDAEELVESLRAEMANLQARDRRSAQELEQEARELREERERLQSTIRAAELRLREQAAEIRRLEHSLEELTKRLQQALESGGSAFGDYVRLKEENVRLYREVERLERAHRDQMKGRPSGGSVGAAGGTPSSQLSARSSARPSLRRGPAASTRRLQGRAPGAAASAGRLVLQAAGSRRGRSEGERSEPSVAAPVAASPPAPARPGPSPSDQPADHKGRVSEEGSRASGGSRREGAKSRSPDETFNRLYQQQEMAARRMRLQREMELQRKNSEKEIGASYVPRALTFRQRRRQARSDRGSHSVSSGHSQSPSRAGQEDGGARRGREEAELGADWGDEEVFAADNAWTADDGSRTRDSVGLSEGPVQDLLG